MKERFEGEKNFKALVETLCEQQIVAGNSNVAEEIAKLGQLDEIKKGTTIITQDAEDRDVFLVLTARSTSL